MRRPSLVLGALLGGLTSLPLIALWYLGQQVAGLVFVPFDIFDWLARVLPGNIITLAIDTIVNVIRTFNLGPTSSTAKLIEQFQAIGLAVGGSIVLGLATAWVLRRSSRPGWQVGFVVGLVALLPILAIELRPGAAVDPASAVLWLVLTIVGWGALLGRLLDRRAISPVAGEVNVGRREALIKIAGGSAAIALGAWGLGRWLGTGQEATGASQPLASPATQPSATPLATPPATPPTPQTSPAATPPPTPIAAATMRERVEPAPGTRPELTSNRDFYRIDINTRPVVVDGQSWALEVAGLFDRPRPLTLADLMAYPAVTQAITLSCISNPIGGDLISTGNWTGARLRDVLKDLGLRPEAKELAIQATDGFYESVTMEDMMDPRTLLVYGMNGETLPVEHGFPLRIYRPDRYGMKQPKWITRIEAIDHPGAGYWVERGWSAAARPQIVSVIDTVAVKQAVDGKVPVGGIAWAGDRGIQKVEVQVDEGEWVAAVLRTPPLSQLTWVQWRYDWPLVAGSHRFRVRATDGTGALQKEEVTDVRPDGATGYHTVQVNI
jgi:DMSO/TMAO reductase YedYZ molybdopterin-dependent catalytic subunit